MGSIGRKSRRVRRDLGQGNDYFALIGVNCFQVKICVPGEKLRNLKISEIIYISVYVYNHIFSNQKDICNHIKKVQTICW